MGTPANAPPPGYTAPPPSGYGAPPANWTPPPAAAPMPARPMNWDMISFLLRFVGFALIFLGALLAIVLSTPSGSLYGSSFSASNYSNFLQSYANGVLVGRLLASLGAFALGMGAGIKLRYLDRLPQGASSEQFVWILIDRIINYVVLAGAILILVWLLWLYPIMSISPPVTIPGA